MGDVGSLKEMLDMLRTPGRRSNGVLSSVSLVKLSCGRYEAAVKSPLLLC